MTTGLCECGCGMATRVAPRTVGDGRSWRQGEHLRFVHGHNNRGALSAGWKGEKAGYVTIHKWLNRNHPKSGICEKCGVTGVQTDYAFKRHPEKHTRDRGDYSELCQTCHWHFDRDEKEWKRPSHCKRGHEFAPENTYVTTKGRRECRACTRLRRSQKLISK